MSLVERALRNAETAKARREQARREMVESAAVVDAFRAAFGVAWVRMTENGKTLEGGKRTEDKKCPPIPGVTNGR